MFHPQQNRAWAQKQSSPTIFFKKKREIFRLSTRLFLFNIYPNLLIRSDNNISNEII